MFVSSIHHGAAPAGRDTATAPAASGSKTVGVAVDNPIGQQAQQWGISACLGRIVTLSDSLTRDSDSRWLATRGRSDPNSELFAATIATKKEAAGLQEISNLHAAPVGNGHCNTAYSSTIYVAQPCQKTHAIVFPAYYQRIDFGSDFVEAYATADGSGRLFLFPAGDAGCVAVKTETFY